jgi:hypothetical protein
MAASMTNQMKTAAYTYFQAPTTFPKNSSIAANETMVSDRPAQKSPSLRPTTRKAGKEDREENQPGKAPRFVARDDVPLIA